MAIATTEVPGIRCRYRPLAVVGLAWHFMLGVGSMIAKTIIIAKLFRVHSTNFFRQKKTFRDHEGVVGRLPTAKYGYERYAK
jgi:hypothetical protein